MLHFRPLYKVLAREGTGGDPPAQQAPDPDTADAMGCFASPKRLGHHGSISDMCVLSYEATNVSVRSYTWVRLRRRRFCGSPLDLLRVYRAAQDCGGVCTLS